MNKSILYIHESCPNPNKSGSDLIIYRHLKRSEENGFEIFLILPKTSYSAENKKILPSSWKILAIPNKFIKLWMINRFRYIVYLYFFIFSFRFILISRCPFILSYFWGFNFSGFARYISAIFNKRLIYFYHDRFEYFFPKKNINRLIRYEDKNMKAASLILTVSSKLVYDNINHNKHKILLPIPEGFVVDKFTFKNVKNWVYSGTVYASQLKFFKILGEILDLYNTSLTIVSNLENEAIQDFKFTKNVILKERFQSNKDALEYLSSNATVILVAYPEEIIKMPWINDSFPSKFLEYCFLKTPIIAFSPKSSAFYEWCVSENFNMIFSKYDTDSLNDIVVNSMKESFIKESIDNQEKINLKINPEKIQKRFENFLLNILN